jgi:hypothetical protein
VCCVCSGLRIPQEVLPLPVRARSRTRPILAVDAAPDLENGELHAPAGGRHHPAQGEERAQDLARYVSCVSITFSIELSSPRTPADDNLLELFFREVDCHEDFGNTNKYLPQGGKSVFAARPAAPSASSQ